MNKNSLSEKVNSFISEKNKIKIDKAFKEICLKVTKENISFIEMRINIISHINNILPSILNIDTKIKSDISFKTQDNKKYNIILEIYFNKKSIIYTTNLDIELNT